MNYIIGVDLGGTYIKAGAVSTNGDLLNEISLPSHAEISPDAVAQQIAKAVKQLQSQR
ncbi:MAG: ROK family protein, partial [Candidatus Kryptoniota bacterium]